MVTKTALVVGAFKVAVLAGCAADVQQQRHSNAILSRLRSGVTPATQTLPYP
jgi:hypothetical protein